MMSTARCASAVIGVLLWSTAAAGQPTAAANGCAMCHATLTETRLSAPAASFAQQDVHRENGFRCADCHGGSAEASERIAAHDPGRGFKGVPSGQTVIATCARCHGDAELMRRYAPRQRVDQAAEYVTSVHGKRLASGDQRVATCISCHGAHGIRPVKDVKSPVYPTNVAGTCGSCHGSPARMAGYTLDNGSPLPTNQVAQYEQSVHHAALTKGNDLSAPTCNDCHGNHGAAPPGAGSVAKVCGTCHAVFAQKFEPTAHGQLFDKGCVECHSNHAVVKPSDALLGIDSAGLCGTCHGKGDSEAVAAETMRAGIERLKARIDASSALVTRVANAGVDMSGQELGLAKARSELTLARTEVHTFDAARVTSIVDTGLAVVGDVDAAGNRGLDELRYRRRGLALSLAAILLVVVALALKIRQVDRRAASR